MKKILNVTTLGFIALILLPIFISPQKVLADAYSGPGCDLYFNELTGEQQSPTCKYVRVIFVLTATENALDRVYLVNDVFAVSSANPSEQHKKSRTTDILLTDGASLRKIIEQKMTDSPLYANHSRIDGEIDRWTHGNRGGYYFLDTYLIPQSWYQAHIAPHTRLEDKGIWQKEFELNRTDEGDPNPKGFYWADGQPVVSIADFDTQRIFLQENWDDVRAPWYRTESGEVQNYVSVVNPLKNIEIVHRMALTDDNLLVLRLWKQIDYFEDGTTKETVYSNIADLPQGATLKYYNLASQLPEDQDSADTTNTDMQTEESNNGNQLSTDEIVNESEQSWWRTVIDFLFGWIKR